ncbi:MULTISPECIES: hypothetical protein [Acetobacteraceae]|uniref:Uncharacterized protein n=2 Tax=Acetobacteraceae TaxID=433 RepID=A0A850P9E2_9PROT|nr:MULTISPECIES: hypothetical protein [Acetobacteraceae]MBS4076525.1 hypothetical protein [Ameyamaea chiangmaiensis]NVN39583.1 hypothetical protein [Ameyamaea chiangmaiensis]GLP89981.1 hypothetical protein GCM10007868_10560 [Gluconobacter frateurii]
MSFIRPISPRPLKSANSALEAYVCWSRMQSEAGQSLDAIIDRKERERQAGQGLFLWGVGNAPATAIRKLALMGMPIPIVFSTMKSKPKAVDMAPSRTVVWRRYVDENGIERLLPKSALVTSRGESAKGAKKRHYALMCYSDTPLRLIRGVPFDPGAFRNVSGVGAPIGASQVTALLRQVAEPNQSPAYEANVVAWLTGGYWVRLSDPRELDSKAIANIASFNGSTDEWLELVSRVRGSTTRTVRRKAEALLL